MSRSQLGGRPEGCPFKININSYIFNSMSLQLSIKAVHVTFVSLPFCA